MKAQRDDGGLISMAVVTPVLVAVVAGAVAMLGAIQIVNLASAGSEPVAPLSGEVQYGNR